MSLRRKARWMSQRPVILLLRRKDKPELVDFITILTKEAHYLPAGRRFNAAAIIGSGSRIDSIPFACLCFDIENASLATLLSPAHSSISPILTGAQFEIGSGAAVTAMSKLGAIFERDAHRI